MSTTDSDVFIPMDKAARAYIAMRDEIAKIQKEYDSKIEALKGQQDQIRYYMMEELKKLGVTSMRTLAGTIIMSPKTRYFTNDWDAFKEFVKANDALDLFEKRIAQKNTAEWLKENPDKVPPGLSSESTYDVSVRKA